jgi:hypothetical protein
MIDAAIGQSPFIELCELTPALAAFLARFFEIPQADNSKPVRIPAKRDGVSWESYESFLVATNGRLLRHSYADGTLELMSPRVFERENSKAVLRRFVQSLTIKLNQPVMTLGETRLASRSRQLGIEPDEAFSLARRIGFRPGHFSDVASLALLISRSRLAACNATIADRA